MGETSAVIMGLSAYKKRAEEAEAVAAELEAKYIKLLEDLTALSAAPAPASSAGSGDITAAEAKIVKLEYQKAHLVRSVKELMARAAAPEEEAAPAQEGAAAEEEEGVRGSSTHVDLNNLKDSGTGELSAEEFAALRAKTKSAAECAKNMTPEQQA